MIISLFILDTNIRTIILTETLLLLKTCCLALKKVLYICFEKNQDEKTKINV